MAVSLSYAQKFWKSFQPELFKKNEYTTDLFEFSALLILLIAENCPTPDVTIVDSAREFSV
jgi:hypothetical protein